jgi:hypothetical protein
VIRSIESEENSNVDTLSEFVTPDLHFLLDLLFETYPTYNDRESRRAVEHVFVSLTNGPQAGVALPIIVNFLKTECVKTGIAHINTFVLADWCSTLLQQFALAPEQWSIYGMEVANAAARVLETCMGAGGHPRAVRIQESAMVTTRRALRKLFAVSKFGEEALAKLVESLTAKGPSSTAGNAVFLGIVAGVCSRLPAVQPQLEQHKQEYYTFYVRELVGSRIPLPKHISNALHDFFDSFPTLDELRKEVIPPIEKALLRAPEVVLNDIVSPMILALPDSMDLSEILHGNLLKPLLSNVKSTNPTIRAGALRTFESLASRSRNDSLIAKVADEILNPLKQGKVTVTDQKILHAQMLSALPGSVSLSQKIPVAIAPVALKEPNEPALVAEVSTLTKHLTFGMANGVTLDKSVTDAFIKGIADKRVPIRRVWALRAADIWWNFSSEQLAQQDIVAFCQATLPKLVEIWQEVLANPILATQNGLVTVGHYVIALLLSKVRVLDEETLTAIYKKSDVLSQAIAIQPKPSFLLNPRVYTKLATEDDIEIALRALVAIAPSLSQDGASVEAQEAWSQAFIYFIVAQNVPGKAKAAARDALTRTYIQEPAKINSIIAQGIWSWYRMIEQGDKESAAVAAKTGTGELGTVLNCLCLPETTLAKFGATIPAEALRQQCLDLIVLARAEIVPRTSWIELCLRMGVDPGQLVRDHLEDCMALINNVTTVRELHCPILMNNTDLGLRTNKMSLSRALVKLRIAHIPTWLLLRPIKPYQPL